MAYFLFIISIVAIINSLVTKRAGLRASYVNLKEHPKLFFLGLSIYCFSLILSFLCIIHVIDL